MLGALYITLGLEKKQIASLKKGLDHLKRASDKEDEAASLALANCYLNEEIIKFPTPDKKKLVSTDKEKEAIALLEKLGNAGNIKAWLSLGYWYNAKNFPEATSYFLKAKALDENNAEVAFALARTYLEKPALIKNDYVSILNLLHTVIQNSKNKIIKKVAQLYQISLSILHKAALANAQSLLKAPLDSFNVLGLLEDILVKNDESFIKEIIKIENENNFSALLEQECCELEKKIQIDTFETETIDSKQKQALLAKGFCALGWWKIINNRPDLSKPIKPITHKEYTIGKQYVEKAAAMPVKSINALAWRVQYHLAIKEYVRAKNYMVECLHEMHKRKMALKDFPLVTDALEELKREIKQQIKESPFGMQHGFLALPLMEIQEVVSKLSDL